MIVTSPRATRTARSSLLAGLSLLATAPALAQDGGETATASGASALSADPEMVFMRFGHNAIPGVHVPDADVRNSIRVGVGAQYQRNPVVAYRLDKESGPVVENRIATQVGISWDFAKWGTARLMLPINANWGRSISGFEAPGAGVGDIMLGASFLPYQSKWFNFGLRGDVFFPSGRSQAYMGERSVRGNLGLTAMGKFANIVDLVGDVAVVARPTVDTQADFNLGSELVLSEALRIKLPWIPVNITQTLIARGGFTNFFQGGAENALELMGGVQIPLRDVGFNTDVTIDAMAGRGTNQGFGATDLRVLAAITITRNPGRKPKPEVVEVERPPIEIPPPFVPPPEDPEETVVEREDRIEVREPIEFFVDTANIKPASLSVLRKVAAIMNGNATIGHLVVEGHASAEGDFAYNYALSKDRAESIWKQLILDGVDPARVSFRGMGEVQPKVQGDSEEAYEANRRVEFKIVSRLNEFDLEGMTYPSSTLAPWSGGSVQLEKPLTPAERQELEMRKKKAKEADAAAADFSEGGTSGEDFSFESGETSEAPAETVERPEREGGDEPDLLEDASFGDGAVQDDGFNFEGESSTPEPAPEPEPEAEPEPGPEAAAEAGEDEAAPEAEESGE